VTSTATVQSLHRWGTGFSSNDKIANFNGDGKDDIVQLWDANRLSTGTGFTPYTAWGTGVRSSDQIGDFNGDSKADVIEMFEDNGAAYVWLSTGTSFRQYQVWGKGLAVGDSAGDDTYVFTGAGVHDVLQLDASIWAGYGDVLNHTTDDGFGNTTIAFGGNSILLLHVTKALLVLDDFQFV